MPLTPRECEAVIVESIRAATGFGDPIESGMRLQQVGIRDAGGVRALLETIAYSKEHGTRQHGLRLDLAALPAIPPETRIGALRDIIMVYALPGDETFSDEQP